MNLAPIVLLMTMSINPGSDHIVTPLPGTPRIRELIEAGQFAEAEDELRALAGRASGEEKEALRFEIERLDRIRKDFSVPEDQLLERVRQQIPDVTAKDIARWREQGVLDATVIDGNLRYDRRAHRNLFRLSAEAKRRRKGEPEPVERKEEMRKHIGRVVAADATSGSFHVLPQRLRIEYTLSVKADAVPAGEMVRCWLLYPHEDPTQRDIQLVSASPGEPVIAPATAPQRTIYMEQPAAADKPTVFSVTYEYTASAFYREIDPNGVKPYDTSSAEYVEFTSERPPHLAFTPEIRQLARKAVGREVNPYLKAKRIFDWIDRNVTYTWMWEYSTIPGLSQFCALERRGDCGIQGLLFIAMCRVSGVPARWESGWSVEPWGNNMHDWVRFFVEPYGWLWADPSRGYVDSPDAKIREFYFGNKDCFRMATNSDYSAPLYPPKQHFRSETVDFQRGEVEWRGGNLYYDQWDWEIKITPIGGGNH